MSSPVSEVRAEALAVIALTRRSDLRVERTLGADRGYDILVTHLQEGVATGHVFGVQVKGLLRVSSVETLNMRMRLKLARWAQELSVPTLPFPVALLVFSVDIDKGYCGWLSEPYGRGRARKLRLVASPKMSELSTETLQDMIDEVDEWYGSVV